MIAVRQRRRILGLAAITLLVVDALLIASYPKEPTTWVIRDPSLESYQLAHPYDILFGSEATDERVPPASVIDPTLDERRPSILRDVLTCKPQSVIVEEHEKPPQVPIRFYLTTRRDASSFSDCLRRRLPAGYVIERSAKARNEAPGSVRFPATLDVHASAGLTRH